MINIINKLMDDLSTRRKWFKDIIVIIKGGTWNENYLILKVLDILVFLILDYDYDYLILYYLTLYSESNWRHSFNSLMWNISHILTVTLPRLQTRKARSMAINTFAKFISFFACCSDPARPIWSDLSNLAKNYHEQVTRS